MKRENVVNIVHFIRGQDVRVGDEALFETFLRQLEYSRECEMPYTLLLQYDALIRPGYVEALRANADDKNMEVGVWVEFCKELIADKLGLPWHGREGYGWDWFVDPDMTVAYSVDDRKRILDEIMGRFYDIFGYYPKSVGSWLFDAVTMDYLSERYGVDAFCNCKEQVGTDGYTLWGGYYNQGYYASKNNMLSPAQTKKNQIGTPMFRMLGVDPIRQYESGLDERWNPAKMQKVFTMEPACACGKDPAFVDWYLSECLTSGALSFGNVQVGQENSFLWENMKAGWTMQAEKIKVGYLAGRFQVEKLCDTGKRFKERYPETPATAVVALRDFDGEGRQTVWYDCKNYRLNLYRDDTWFGIRDAFLFDETYAERYLTDVATGNYAEYDTLPLLDGYHWGGDGIRAFAAIVRADGTAVEETKILGVEEDDPELSVILTADGARIRCICRPEGLRITADSGDFALRFTFRSTGETTLSLTQSGISYVHRGHSYALAINHAPEPIDEHTVSVPIGKELTIRRG